MTPLLTLKVYEQLIAARDGAAATVSCSLDLERSVTTVEIGTDAWTWDNRHYPYPERIKDRTIYHWTDAGFEAAARFSQSLIKLVPTEWGPPTFEIDGIKMLPTAHVSPYADAERKVSLVQPRGKIVLDTCGGLGYFAAWCLHHGAGHVFSYEKSADVLWLRSLNPWSPGGNATLTLNHADVAKAITALPAGSVECVLHDPPRFGIAGELYSQVFYDHLARVLKVRGKLFHYTGTPNRLTSGRDVPGEVTSRLRHAGFTVERNGDGLLASRR